MEIKVYEYWSDDECLYVGLTNNWGRREREHRANAPWYGQQNRVVLHLAGSNRTKALEVESKLINKLSPKYNNYHNPLTVPTTGLESRLTSLEQLVKELQQKVDSP